MRLHHAFAFATFATFAVATLAAAQPSEDAPARRARAPLADVADIEPAVDVGGEAPAQATPPAMPRSTEPGARSPAFTSGPAEAPLRAAAPSRVMDTLDLGTTSITGNQELPKVLYIVPWKKSDLGELVGRPVNTLLDEVLAPVDPRVFERHLEYYEALYGESRQE